ncbi:hypothetical protein JXL21_09290 [Candidatus Bathyarchaeota archaeon]|nr:hypothetical protein [Candidatus Bathyarchaeota archaeon]
MLLVTMLVAGAVAVLLAVYVVRVALARPVRPINTRVADKATERSVLYSGVFIPITIHYLVTSEGYKVKVREQVYRLVEVGDALTVFEYSDGSHRLG